MTGDRQLDAGESAERSGDFGAAAAAYRLAIDSGDPVVVPIGRFRLGRVAWRQGRYDEALRLYHAALPTDDTAHGAELSAMVHNGIGAVHYARGAYAQARAAYQVALDQTRDDALRGKVQLNLGVIANIEGDLDGARDLYERSRSIFRQAGDRSGEALALHNIGMLLADRSDWEGADEAYEECLTICEEQGNVQMVANVLLSRSEILAARGTPEVALSHCDRAIAIYDTIADEVGRAEALRWQGHALRRLGRWTHGERSLTEAMRIAVRAQLRLLEAEAARELGLLKHDAGDIANAKHWLTIARERFTLLNARREIDEVALELARLGGPGRRTGA